MLLMTGIADRLTNQTHTAGEAVADDMLLNLFKVMYKDLGKYNALCG